MFPRFEVYKAMKNQVVVCRASGDHAGGSKVLPKRWYATTTTQRITTQRPQHSMSVNSRRKIMEPRYNTWREMARPPQQNKELYMHRVTMQPQCTDSLILILSYIARSNAEKFLLIPTASKRAESAQPPIQLVPGTLLPAGV